jgi:hypothetical protein
MFAGSSSITLILECLSRTSRVFIISALQRKEGQENSQVIVVSLSPEPL